MNLWRIGWNSGRFKFAGRLRVPIPITFPEGAVIDYILLDTESTFRPYWGICTDPGLFPNAPGLLVHFGSVPNLKFPGPFDVFPD